MKTVEWIAAYYLDAQFAEKAVTYFEKAALMQLVISILWINDEKWIKAEWDKMAYDDCFVHSEKWQLPQSISIIQSNSQ